MPTPTAVVRWQEFDGQDGLAEVAGRLVAYLDGQEVASAPLPDGSTARQLMLDYAVPALLPTVGFAHTPPRQLAIEITLNDANLPGEVGGVFVLDGEEHLWYAYHDQHPDFRRHDELPEGTRNWARSSDSGFEFMLPGSVQTHPDPVITKRTALALEAFLHALADERDIPLPYRRAFSNVFSAADPTWSLNLPRLISVEERGVRDLV